MKRFQQNIRKVVPYVPGDQPDFPDMIKLNTNENPYPPAPEVQEVLAKSNAEQMRLYPDPTAHQLNAAIAEAYGISPSWRSSAIRANCPAGSGGKNTSP